MKTTYALLFFMVAFIAMGQENILQTNKRATLESILETDTVLQGYLRDNDMEYQLLYTQIDRGKEGSPKFKSFKYERGSMGYFYPASSVKLPIAALALEKLRTKPEVSLFDPMLTDSVLIWQTSMFSDSLGTDGFPTVGDHIKKTLIYSDNNSFNRLYEFLGPEYINSRLKELGISKTRIVHRLSLPLTPEQNGISNPVILLDGNRDTIWKIPAVKSKVLGGSGTILKGRGYIKEGVLVDEPMDFTDKNRFPLKDQQEILKRIIFPDAYRTSQQFRLEPEDYAFLLEQMSTVPRHSKFPEAIKSIPDSYAKNFLYDKETLKLLPNIRIFNKIGVAYGFMIDNAYIIDVENNIEFLLSVVINVNINGIYNDNTYAYDTIGYPFLLRLSELIYAYELQRKRKQTPDLSRFQPYGNY